MVIFRLPCLEARVIGPWKERGMARVIEPFAEKRSRESGVAGLIEC